MEHLTDHEIVVEPIHGMFRIFPGHFNANIISSDNTYSNPPPVVYSNGAGAPGSGASNDANAQAWQEYYKKYYEYYGQYPQGQGSVRNWSFDFNKV